MISKKVASLLEEQIGHELWASQKYLSMAIWFAGQNLGGFSEFFMKQSAEERGHALKIVHFLTEVGLTPNLAAIDAAGPKYKDALDCANQALQNEQTVTKQFHKMAKTALAEDDYTSFEFLQWFIKEQVEEEASMEHLIALISSGLNLFQVEALLHHDHD
ncbi:MAG TPA: ferritin [Fimbriimonadaceae bacterium]|nr:ferritin [Fimbriimonadaceae bacterium]